MPLCPGGPLPRRRAQLLSSRISLAQHRARSLLFRPLLGLCALSWKPPVFLPHHFQDFALNDNILQLCVEYVTKGHDFVMAQRLNFVQRGTARAQQFTAAEMQFHKSLNPAVEKVVHEQQFLLLLEMLKELGFPKYRTLMQLMYIGSPLIGQLEETHIFERRAPPCTTSLADFYRRSLIAPGGVQGLCLAKW